MTTRAERATIIEQTNSNASLEGFSPDGEDIGLQQQFIEGNVSVDDLLAAARAFASKAGSQEP